MLLKRIHSGSAAVVSALLLAPVASAQLTFENKTADAGIDVSLAHAADHPGDIMDGGGTVIDANADGWPDLFLPSTGIFPDRLFINQKDGTFADEAAAWGLTGLYRGVSATAGDYDKNGYQDLYVASMGDMSNAPSTGQNRLYRNNGNGTFSEVAESAGVAYSANVPDGFSSCFGDYDLDGDLDLYVTGWVPGSLGNRLYRNEGDGTFTDVTEAANVANAGLRGFAPRFNDMNHDRHPSLLVAADFGTSKFFANQLDGTFVDVTGGLLPDRAWYGMGGCVADFDNDGWLDWYVTSIYFDPPGSAPNGNRLYLNEGVGGGLVAVPESAGVNDGGWSWGTVASDFDQDGYVDIAVTNGWNKTEFMGERSYLFRNKGNVEFEEISAACGLDHIGQGRGLVQLDYDRDGDMDLVFFTNQDQVALFRNDITGPACNWLRIELDTSANPALAPDGFGTRIELSGTVGGVPLERVSCIDGGSSYLGSSQLTAHFGLGPGTVVDEVKIFWTDGFETVLENVAVNQILKVHAQKPFEQEPLVRGTQVDNVIRGLRPGEIAYFCYSATGTGPGPCLPAFGDHCMDLSDPIFYLGSAVADASGTATLTMDLPAATPLVTLHTQAAVQRGDLGLLSLKTNGVSATVLP